MMASGNEPSHHVSSPTSLQETAPVNPEEERQRGTSTTQCTKITGIIISVVIFFLVLSLLFSAKRLSTIRSRDDSKHSSDGVGARHAILGKNTLSESYYKLMVNDVERAMNTSADPCQDFYQYACGRWGVHNPSPHDKIYWTNFKQMKILLWKTMEVRLKGIVIDITRKRASRRNLELGDPYHKILELMGLRGDPFQSITVLAAEYYNSCINEDLQSLKGVSPIKDVLHEMDQLYLNASQKFEPLKAFQKVLEFIHHKMSLHVLFSWIVQPDTVHNAMVIEMNVPKIHTLIKQGTDLKGKERLITTYGQYARALLKMVGTFNNNSLDNEVSVILELFKVFRPLKGSTFVNRTTVGNLNKLAPILDWQEYFSSAFNRVGTHITKNEDVLSEIYDYLRILSEHIQSEISTWELERLYVYLRWEVIEYYSHFLHKPARNVFVPLFEEITNVKVSNLAHYRFYPCVKEMVDRLSLVISHLLLETVKESLPKGVLIDDNIKAVTEMAHIIRRKYLSYIDSFTWLTPNAKRVLLEKLSNADIKVGYPPILANALKLRNHFRALKFTNNYFTNQVALLRFNQDNSMRILRQPQLYSEWQFMSPMSVSSFYMYRSNTLVIPLGGFMHPIYNTNLPNYLKYASMGTIISHELGHAIDIVGGSRDLYGKFNESLWDEITNKAFLKQLECRVKQYSEAYYPIHQLMTIAEVMADDASVGTAFMAATQHFQQINLPPTIMNFLANLDLSPEQFFFLYYAQIFCSASISKSSLLDTEDHYPPNWARITATLTNTPQFHEVFGCHKGTGMNPEMEDCQIW